MFFQYLVGADIQIELWHEPDTNLNEYFFRILYLGKVLTFILFDSINYLFILFSL